MNSRNRLSAMLSHFWPLFFLAATALTGCTYPTESKTLSETTLEPPPPTQVYFYPSRGQNATRQDFDHYQCYLWAVKETGFNPSAPYLAPHQKIGVVPHPSAGRDTLAGATAGAIIGAIAAPHGKTGTGALVGASAGAVAGAVSDAARQEEAERIRGEYAELSARKRAVLEKQASQYRRAMAACLEGRGYTVSSE